MKEKFKKNWSFYFLIYIFLLIFFGTFFLYSKHDVGNDSSISDWLINYAGGFVRRGLVGEISTYIAYFFSFKLRDVILFFQIIVFTFYYISIFIFFRNVKINRIFILSIFSPIFILYPVAEIEVLGRKELFIFLIIISYFFCDIKNFITQLIFKVFLFPISILIWEPAIIFFPYIILIDLIVFNVNRLNKYFFYITLSYFFLISVSIFVYLNPISSVDFKEMVNVLQQDFGERCYMSCSFVGNQAANSFSELIMPRLSQIKFSYVFRYLLVVLIGFFPLFILLKNSKIKDENKNVVLVSQFKSLLIPFILIFLPSLVLYFTMYDWARVVHISYTFMILTYFFLYKQKLIFINESNLSNHFLSKISKKTFLLVFLIFCFGWNPKVVMPDDVASKPIYAIPYKFYKYFLKN